MSNQTYSTAMVLVMTTESSWDQANDLAKALLRRKLIACASLHQVNSHYLWKGKLEEEKEVQLILKTTNNLLERLWETIVELHSYENPEWIYWSVCSGKQYKSWLLSIVGSK